MRHAGTGLVEPESHLLIRCCPGQCLSYKGRQEADILRRKSRRDGGLSSCQAVKHPLILLDLDAGENTSDRVLIELQGVGRLKRTIRNALEVYCTAAGFTYYRVHLGRGGTTA